MTAEKSGVSVNQQLGVESVDMTVVERIQVGIIYPLGV